jgi:membrane protease YdiL (CAAX protease family)
MSEGAVVLAAPRPRWGVWATLGWFLAAYAALFSVVLVVIAVARFTVAPDFYEPATDWSAAVIGIPSACAAIGLALFAASRSRQPVLDYLGLVMPRGRAWELIGIAALTVLLPILWFAVIAPHVGTRAPPNPLGYGFAPWQVVLIRLEVFVITPLWEEIVYRGLLYRGLERSRLGAVGAVVVTAIVFSLCHFRPSWFSVLYLMSTGLGFAVLRARSGSVLPSIAAHGLANAMPRPLLSAEFWTELWGG